MTDEAAREPGNDSGASPWSIARRAARGAVALGTRQLAVWSISLLAGILLARLFDPSFFGVYALVGSILAVLTIFSDMGLAASIIRQPEQPDDNELYGVFSFQTALIGGLELIALVLCVAAWRQGWLSDWTVGLSVAMLLALGLGSLRTIPAALLERELDFAALARVDVFDMLVFQGTVVAGGVAGLGLWSLPLALVTRAVVDVALVYRARPWRPRLTTRLVGLGPRLAFGLRVQANGLLGFGKDQLWPFLLTALAGAAATGYYGVAYKYAALPVLALNLIVRVLFPTFSRLQERPEALAKAARAIQALILLIGLPTLSGLAGLAGIAIPFVFGAGWQPSIVVAQLLALNTFAGFVTTPVWSLLYVRGREAAALRLFAAWTVCQVGALVAAVLLLPIAAATAAALASVVVTLPVTWIALRWIERELDTAFAGLVLRPLALAVIAALLLYTLSGSGLPIWLLVPAAALILGLQLSLTQRLAPEGLGAIRRLVEDQRS